MTAGVYSCDVQIAGTVYIRASSLHDAQRRLERFIADNAELEVSSPDGVISGRALDHPGLPDASLSPAMTVHGPWPGSKLEPAG